MNNADSANNEYEQSSIDGASSSDHEDLMHQQLLEPARNDSFSASSDEGDNLDNIPWLYTSADEPKAYPMNRKLDWLKNPIQPLSFFFSKNISRLQFQRWRCPQDGNAARPKRHFSRQPARL